MNFLSLILSISFLFSPIKLNLNILSDGNINAIRSVFENTISTQGEIEIEDSAKSDIIIDFASGITEEYFQKNIKNSKEYLLAEKIDLDGDGKKEIIIVKGELEKIVNPELKKFNISEAYILERENDKYIATVDLFNHRKYKFKINEIKNIKLANSKKNFIYISNTDYNDFYGFQLFEYKNKRLNSFLDASSNSNVGLYRIIDEDNDGSLETVVFQKWGSENVHIESTEFYVFNGSTFEYQDTIVNIVEPQNLPLDILDVYIGFKIIGLKDSKQLREFNKKHLSSTLDDTVDYSEKVWKNAFSQFTLVNDEITLDIQKNTDTEFILHLRCPPEVSDRVKDYELLNAVYTLKKDDKGIWKIVNVGF